MFRVSNSPSIEHVDRIDTEAARGARDHNRAPSPSMINKSVIYKRCVSVILGENLLPAVLRTLCNSRRFSLFLERSRDRVLEMYRRPDRTVIDYVRK